MVYMPRLSSFPSCWSLVELCTCVEVFRVGERREDKEGAGGKRRGDGAEELRVRRRCIQRLISLFFSHPPLFSLLFSLLVPAHRLEYELTLVAASFGVDGNYFYTPTGIILSPLLSLPSPHSPLSPLSSLSPLPSLPSLLSYLIAKKESSVRLVTPPPFSLPTRI